MSLALQQRSDVDYLVIFYAEHCCGVLRACWKVVILIEPDTRCTPEECARWC